MAPKNWITHRYDLIIQGTQPGIVSTSGISRCQWTFYSVQYCLQSKSWPIPFWRRFFFRGSNFLHVPVRVCERQLQLIHCWFTATINTIVLSTIRTYSYPSCCDVFLSLLSVIGMENVQKITSLVQCSGKLFIYLQASASHVSRSLESNVVSSSSASAAARQPEPSAPPSDYMMR